MKKNKFLSILSLIALITAAMLTVSCGGSDDDDSGGDYGSGGNIEVPSQLIGTWSITGQQQNGNIIKLVFQFASGGTGKVATYNYSFSSNSFEEEGSASFNYTFDASTSSLVITDNTGSVTYHVDELTSENLTLSDTSGNVYKFISGWGISTVSSDTGYAPSDATNLHIKVGMGKTGGSFDGYFLSNTSINTSYSRWPFLERHSITSASYTKTGANTAKIDFSYAKSGYYNGGSKTIELTFTSSTGGTATSGNLASGVFTVEKFEKAENIQAPYNLSGKRLSVPYGMDTYFVFGDGISNYYPIKKYDGITVFGSISAIYNRISDTRAVITIRDKTDYSTRESTYTLDFYTSTSGKYSYYKDNGRFGTSSWTGDFTLE